MHTNETRQLSFDDAFTQAASEDRPGRAHRYGHDTEHAAAQSMQEISGVIRKRVWDILRANPQGLTDDEGARIYTHIFRAYRTDRLTFGRRRNELYRDGLVEKTDERRPTPTGRNAIVWKASA